MADNPRTTHPTAPRPLPETLADCTPADAPRVSLRQVMARFATGVTVLTVGGEQAHGMTANAFTSVSLDPPMVLCCVAHTARMHQAIADSRFFAVSMLGADQEDVARYFADRRRPQGRDQFAPVDWLPGPSTGAPLLSGAIAWLECEVAETYRGGDHSIFLGSVLSSTCGAERKALMFLGGAFQAAAPGDR